MKNGTQGFTLIELLIVIAIIGILAAVLIPNLLGAREKANVTAAQAVGKDCITTIETLRDNVSGELKDQAGAALATGATCATLMGKPLPASVTSAEVTAVGSDTFEIEVVVNNKDASVWAFDGTQWTFTK